jgi:type IV pilus assembly protein PilO
MFSNLSNREKILLSILGIGGVVFLFVWLILVPQVKAYGETRSQLRDNQVRLMEAEAQAASLPREKEGVVQAEERLKKFDVYFRNNVKSGASVMEVGFKAQRSGVRIKQFKTVGVVNKQYYLELPFKYVVEGQYPDVASFIREMESLSNLSEVRSVNIRPVAVEQGGDKDGAKGKSPAVSTGRVTADFEIVLYSDTSTEGKLMLEEISRWAVGRFNAFSAAAPVSPYRGVKAGSFGIPAPAGKNGNGKSILPETDVPDSSANADDQGQGSVSRYVYVPLAAK